MTAPLRLQLQKGGLPNTYMMYIRSFSNELRCDCSNFNVFFRSFEFEEGSVAASSLVIFESIEQIILVTRFLSRKRTK